jgi:small multidrug resistance pump
MKYALLALAVAFNVGAYLVFKGISAKPHNIAWAGLFAIGLALGAVNVFCFTVALRELRLAVAYPAFAGASITLIVLASAWLFGEKVTMANVVGAGLVVAGIVALTK